MLTRVSPQASGKGRKSDSLGASFRPLRRRRYNPRGSHEQAVGTHCPHKHAHKYTCQTHAAPAPYAKKNNEAWSVGPWLLAPRLGSQGAVSKEFFRPQAPRRHQWDNPGWSGPESRHSWPGEDWRVHLGAGPRPVRLGVRGAHSAPREPRPEGEPSVLSQWLGQSPQPKPLWLWSLLLGTSRVFF